MHLLLIEDNAALRDAVGQFLREAGYLVDSYATGDEGLWAASEIPCDVVLLDLMLPNMDGMEILRRLRAQENPVHVLVISARDGLGRPAGGPERRCRRLSGEAVSAGRDARPGAGAAAAELCQEEPAAPCFRSGGRSRPAGRAAGRTA